MAMLEVKDLHVEIATEDGAVKAVAGLSYELEQGKALGIVGESGSGKSVSVMTVVGLTRFLGRTRIAGEVIFEGRNLLELPESEMRKLRGNALGMIFQDPFNSLHPFYRVSDQLIEAVRAHNDVSAKAARARALELLRLVGIPQPQERIDAYPHQFSGGMRQRVMIATAISNEPRLLIADEPTTALDVTTQAQILELIQRLQSELGMAVILITHDLGVVAELADDVLVMYAGRGIEEADKFRLFDRPEHPYTWGLLRSMPRLDTPLDDELVPIKGRPPSLLSPPRGCPFESRCDYSRPECSTAPPPLVAAEDDAGHRVACVLAPVSRRELWSTLRPATVVDATAVAAIAPEPDAVREERGA